MAGEFAKFFKASAASIANLPELQKEIDAIDPQTLEDIDRLLQGMDKTDGVLTLDGPVEMDAVFALAYHPHAQRVREVRYLSWAEHPKRDPQAVYRSSLEAFAAEHGWSLPDCLLDILRFHDLMEGAVLKGGQAHHNADLRYLPLDGLEDLVSYGFLGEIVKGAAIDPRGLLLNRYGHQEFYYFPLACYGSDRVTWGLVYDFYGQRFTENLICHEDMVWGSPQSTYFDFLLDALRGHLEFLLDECEWEAIEEPVLPWYLLLLTRGYLSTYPPSRPDDHRAGAAGYASASKRELQRLIRASFAPIKKVKGSTVTKAELVQRVQVFFQALLASNQSAAPEVWQGLRDQYRELVPDLKDQAKIGQIFQIEASGKDPDGRELLALVRAAVMNFLFAEIDDSRPWLALAMADELWDEFDEELSLVASTLLAAMPDDFCPPFVKKTAALHATTRFKTKIYTK